MDHQSDHRSLEELEAVIESGDEHLLALAALLKTGDLAAVKAAMLRRGVSLGMIDAFQEFKAGTIGFTEMRARCLKAVVGEIRN